MEGLAHLVTESLVRHGFEPTFDHRRLQWSKWFSCQDRFSLVTAPSRSGLYALGEEVAELPDSHAISPERIEGFPGGTKRMLALFQISEADDLGMALGRLFLTPSPQRDRFNTGRCFARYVVIEDTTQRQAALDALQRWMNASAEAISATPQFSPTTTPQVLSSTTPQTVETLLATTPPGLPNHQIQLEPVSAERSEARSISGYGFSHTTNAIPLGPALAAASAQSAQASESSNRQAQIGPPAPIPSGF